MHERFRRQDLGDLAHEIIDIERLVEHRDRSQAPRLRVDVLAREAITVAMVRPSAAFMRHATLSACPKELSCQDSHEAPPQTGEFYDCPWPWGSLQEGCVYLANSTLEVLYPALSRPRFAVNFNDALSE